MSVPRIVGAPGLSSQDTIHGFRAGFRFLEVAFLSDFVRQYGSKSGPKIRSPIKSRASFFFSVFASRPVTGVTTTDINFPSLFRPHCAEMTNPGNLFFYFFFNLFFFPREQHAKPSLRSAVGKQAFGFSPRLDGRNVRTPLSSARASGSCLLRAVKVALALRV